jgi:TolA-binding protein
VIWTFIIGIFFSGSLPAQVQIHSDTSYIGILERADQWMRAGSYHVVRRELEKIVGNNSEFGRRRDVVFLLARATYEDKDYEEAYQRSSEFLKNYPGDNRTEQVRLMQGISAFHTKRSAVAVTALSAYLEQSEDRSRVGEALYWRAMSELDRGDQQSAQADLERCMTDASAVPYRDLALMGWALSLERRGEYQQALDKLEQLLSGYPASKLRTAAFIRSGSLSMRLHDPLRTVKLLTGIKPETPSQREEYLLLSAEADFRLGSYDRAESEYESFTNEFSHSPDARKAEYGLGWARLKRGDARGAQTVFDSLSTGKDSLAYAAMFQSGVLSELEGNANAAMSRFDTLVEKSPYDRYLDQAYYEMGMIKYRGKLYKDARRYFQFAARLYPESPLVVHAYRMLGESNMALSDFSNAQYAFAQVRKSGTSPDDLAQAFFQEGVALYHLGRFKTCAERFDEYLHKFSHDKHFSQAYVWRGEALYQDGRFDEAEHAYSEALKQLQNDPKKEDALYGYAWTLFEQKKFSQAAEAFDKFTTSYPSSDRSIEASLRKADSYYFLGQYDKASSLYTSLASLKTEGRTIEYAAFQLAMSYIERGETERGIARLRDFLVSYPSSIYDEVVQFNIGWAYFSKEQFSEAIPEFRRVMNAYPASQLMPRVLFNTGDAFFNLKTYDSSRVYYQRVINEYPSSPLVTDALGGLQYTYEAEGKPAMAVAEIDTFLAKKPAGLPQEELLLRKGDILFGQGDFSGAVQEYKRLLSLKPDRVVRAKTLQQLGRAYELQNNPAQAMTYYQQVLSEFSDAENAPAVTLALGIVQVKNKQYRAAMTNLQNFDKRYPESPLTTEAKYHLGVALMNLPDERAAMAQFQSNIASSSENIFADRSRLQIARLHLNRKEYSASVDTLNTLVNRRSDDLAADGLLMIGEVYLAQKKFREALQAYHDVIQQYTDYPLQVERGRLGLGTTYEKMKDNKQARIAYQEILKSPVDLTVKTDVQQRLKKLRK